MANKVSKLLRSFFLDGLFFIALGIAMLVWPSGALNALCVTIGVVIAVIGLLKIIGFISNKSGNRKGLSLFIGIIYIALGCSIIFNPDIFISILQYVIAVILLYGALLMFINAFQLRKVFGMMLIASIVFACLITLLAVIIIINPIAFASFITQLCGIGLIIEGFAMMLVLSVS